MKKKKKERVGFNFKGLLRAFTQSSAVNEDDIERQLEEIRQQEDIKKIEWLIKQTDASASAKPKKAGKARKRGDLTEKVEVKSVDYHEKLAKKQEDKEIGE